MRRALYGIGIGLIAGFVLAVALPSRASHYPAPIAKSLGGTGSTSSTLTADSLACSGCVDLTTEVSATLPLANGGTNATSLAQGACYSTGTALATTAGTTTTVLHGNAAGNPTFAAVALAADVSGTLPVGNGGTGAATLTTGNVLLGAGTSAVTFVAPGTTGNVLTSNGTTWTSAAPTGGGGTTSFYTMATYFPTALPTPVTFGGGQFNSTGYTSVKWQASGFISNTAAVCTITLYNVTDASTASSVTFPATLSNSTSTSGALSLPASNKQYEARVDVTGGFTCTVLWAGLVLQ
jgi:hypothetical protein